MLNTFLLAHAPEVACDKTSRGAIACTSRRPMAITWNEVLQQ